MSVTSNMCELRRRDHARLRLLMLALLFLLPAQVSAQTFTAGEHTVEVTLTPEKSEVMVGEPVFLIFEVRNPSGIDLQTGVGGDYRNRLGRPDSYSLTATGEDGNPVPVIDAGPGMGGFIGVEKIPAGGSHARRLFLQQWIAFERPGTYTIVCKKSLSLSEYKDRLPEGERPEWSSAQVEVRATLKVVPADDGAMGEVIERLGRSLAEAMDAEGDYLTNDRKARDALTGLAFLDDKRVIPHLTSVMKRDTRSFDSLKFTAAYALSKYDDDAALAALVENMKDDDDSLRNTVANALGMSRHPRAAALLLSMRRDKYEGVRLTVVHALGKLKTEESSEVLREMAGDENEMVRKEALRYLSERGVEVR